MLIIRGVGPNAGSYYLDGRAAGYWAGAGAAALGLAGEVQGAALRRVLQGRHPDSGRYLPRVKPVRRRSGWDLMFAAPRSVSLLDAVQPPEDDSVRLAHRAAVSGVMQYLEDKMLFVARSSSPDNQAEATGVLGAVFEHRQNAAAEPHLHTHYLLVNLTRGPESDWAAVAGGAWRLSRRGLFALYQVELRHHLAGHGWNLDWRIRPDGTVDLADVPRAAVRQTSTQGRAAQSVGRIAARRLASPQPWRERSAAAGFDAATMAGRSFDAGGTPPPRLEPNWSDAVADRLLATRSVFRRADVMEAVAASLPSGATSQDVGAWTDEFLAGAVRIDSPYSTPRWTTRRAEETDRELVAATMQLGPTGG